LNSDTASITIVITGVNDAPTAQDDNSGTMGTHDTLITLSTSSVLTNDSDPDYDTLTVSISSATNRTATINDNGTPSNASDDIIEFTPNPNFAGTATITYTASDGIDSDTAIITLQVWNAAPSASNDSYWLMEDQEFTAAYPGNVLGNDSDTDGDLITVSLVTGPSDAAIFVLNGNGTFEYRPVSDWFDGSDQFVYELSDGIDTAQATVTISSMSPSSIRYADAGDPPPGGGHCLIGPSGTYQELGMDDVVTVYDNNDSELTNRTLFQADSDSFSNAADFGTPIGSHSWGELLMQLDAYVQANGLINELYIFDHATDTKQQFGVDIVTAEMFAELAPLMSPTGTVVLAGCKVGSNAAYCNSVADAIGPNITVSATAGKVAYFPRPFARDYWAVDGIWLNFTGTGP
jgi:Big-like domain-containing protein/cadherin-like protein